MKKLSSAFCALIILFSFMTSPILAAPSSESGKSSSSPSSSSSKNDKSSSKDEKSSSKNDKSSSKNDKSSSKEDKSSSKDEKNSSKDASSSSESGSKKTDDKNPPVNESGSSSALPPPPFADELMSKAFCMINIDSGSRVYEKNAQEKLSPASLTKIMTCILALENVKDLDAETTPLKTYINNYLYSGGVDTLGGIAPGESLSIRDLLYAMMLQSANEAAMMVADYVGGGDLDYFYELMNNKAKEIGAVNTHFSSSTGLYDENNYSTAYDLALIAQYAMKNDEFMKIVSTLSYTSSPTSVHPSGITWYSNNSMQKSSSTEYYYEGLKGIKTGSLPEQNMRNFVSCATRDGYTYLLVVLGAPYKRESDGASYEKNFAWKDTAALYDWAFETFKVKTLMSVGKEVTEVGVRLSWDKDHVKLLAADKFASLVPVETTEDSVTTITEIYDYVELPLKGQKGKTEKYIDAPIKKGDEVGYVKLMLAGEEVGRVRLVAAETIEQSAWLHYVDIVKGFFNTFLFKFVITFIIVAVILYIVLMFIRNRNKRRYKGRRGNGPPTTPRSRR